MNEQRNLKNKLTSLNKKLRTFNDKINLSYHYNVFKLKHDDIRILQKNITKLK